MLTDALLLAAVFVASLLALALVEFVGFIFEDPNDLDDYQ